jgi:hypothetical protein
MVALSIKNRSEENLYGYDSDGDKKFEKYYDVQPGTDLTVESDVGNIKVTSTDLDRVEILVTARGSDRFMKKFSVESEQTGDEVRVYGKMKRSNFNIFNNGWTEVSFEIKVPKKMNLKLSTSGGNIEVENVTGKMEGETSGGNIELAGVESDLKMSTSGGNVKIYDCSGSFDLETSGGNMYVKNVRGPIKLETSGGNIDVTDSQGKVYASTSGGNVTVSLKGNEGIDLSTSGGNINLSVPRSITANVEAEASGGDVTCDLEFSGKIKDGSMKAKINGGGNNIKLETSGGDIVITPNE